MAKQVEYEFYGPWLGPLGIMLGLPAVCYWLVCACNSAGCWELARPLQMPGLPPGTALLTAETAAAVAAWLALQACPGLAAGPRREPPKAVDLCGACACTAYLEVLREPRCEQWPANAAVCDLLTCAAARPGGPAPAGARRAPAGRAPAERPAPAVQAHW